MKLINKTKYISDSVLKLVLMGAKKSLGKSINTNIMVMVRFSKHGGGYIMGNLFRVCGKWNPKNPDTWIYVKGGVVMEVTIPKNYFTDAITSAESFFETCKHEWGHVYDVQQSEKGKVGFGFAGDVNKRRTKHSLRPEEMRVEEYVASPKVKGFDSYEAIMMLAIEIEKIFT